MTDLEATYPMQEPGEASPSPRKAPWQLATAIIGLLVIAAGALFAVRSTSGGAGADSPEDAVEAMFEALEKRDVIGILEVLDPGERDALRQPIVDMADQLRRLDILDDDLDLSSIEGLSFSVEGLTTSAESLGDGVSAVSLTGGTITTSFEPEQLPLGEFTRKVAGEALEEAEPETDTTDIAEDGPAVVVAVERDGGWFVSLGYSVAENARRDTEQPVPAFGKGVPAVGATSPEAAVRDLLESAAELDVRRLIELMPPDEMGALHDYAPLFLPDAEESLAEVRQNLTTKITTLDLDTSSAGGGTLVQVRKLEFEGTYDDGESERTSFSYKGGCVDVKVEGDQPMEPPDAISAGNMHFCPNELSQSDLPVPFFARMKGPDIQLENPELGFVTVQRDGKWFVSPTRTLLQGGVAILKVFDRADLDALHKWFTVDLQEQMESSFEGSSGGAAGSIDFESGEFEEGPTSEESPPGTP